MVSDVVLFLNSWTFFSWSRKVRRSTKCQLEIILQFWLNWQLTDAQFYKINISFFLLPTIPRHPNASSVLEFTLLWSILQLLAEYNSYSGQLYFGIRSPINLTYFFMLILFYVLIFLCGIQGSSVWYTLDSSNKYNWCHYPICRDHYMLACWCLLAK